MCVKSCLGRPKIKKKQITKKCADEQQFTRRKSVGSVLFNRLFSLVVRFHQIKYVCEDIDVSFVVFLLINAKV